MAPFPGSRRARLARETRAEAQMGQARTSRQLMHRTVSSIRVHCWERLSSNLAEESSCRLQLGRGYCVHLFETIPVAINLGVSR